MKLPNFGYHLALWQGRLTRDAYRAAASVVAQRRIDPPRKINIDVFSYSSEAMLAEQIASIRSFVRYAGRPNRFTVVSDGTHSQQSIRLLREIDPSVEVRETTPPPPADLPEPFRAYLAGHPTGKQLALVMSLPHDAPALYIDADVLFFPGAAALASDVSQMDGPASYLADCQFSGDARILQTEEEKHAPVNTGVLLLFSKLDWSIAASRFPSASFAPNFFTNQTLTHLVMHQNRARPLDPDRYVLQLDDQCEFRDRYAHRAIVLRHYVNPVRHKFWTSLLY